MTVITPPSQAMISPFMAGHCSPTPFTPEAIADTHLDLAPAGGSISRLRMAATLRHIDKAINLPPQGQVEVDLESVVTDYLETGTGIKGLPRLVPPALTRMERAKALLQECQAALAGPAANLLAVGGRTGVIVAMSVILRDIARHYAQEALASDPADSNKAWAAMGVFLVGPCLNILGLAREEWQGSANLRSRLGRTAMLGLSVGLGISMLLQGGFARQLGDVAGATFYSVIRDITSAFFLLPSNVEDFNLLSTTAAAGLFAGFGGLLEAGVLALRTVPGNLTPGLGFDVFGCAVNASAAAALAVFDDLVLGGLNYQPPADAPDQSFTVGVDPRLASADQLVAAATTGLSLRSSALNVINFAVAMALMAAAEEGGDQPQNHLLTTGVVALMLMVIYLPFVYGTLSSPRAASGTNTTRL